MNPCNQGKWFPVYISERGDEDGGRGNPGTPAKQGRAGALRAGMQIRKAPWGVGGADSPGTGCCGVRK